jgi:hypothetical protein
MARCRVCHRELTSADAIMAGIGPVCAAKAAARAVANGDARSEDTGYPRARYERIVRGQQRLADLWMRAVVHDAWARAEGTAEERAEAAWQLSLICHWAERAKRMERRAAALLSRRTH